MESETMAKLYLELSQVLGADVKTERELYLEAEVRRLRHVVVQAYREGALDQRAGRECWEHSGVRGAIEPWEVTDGQR